MKFFNSKIVTKTISLEDALKTKEQPKVRTLDEILASAGQIKTAAAQAETKTAAVEVPEVKAPEAKEEKAQEVVPAAKVEEKVVAQAAAPAVQVKVAEEMTKAPEAKKDEPKVETPKTASLKISKELDFRGWKAEDVAKAWEQHGSLEKCVASVGAKASDAKAYCGLLRVAASEATKMVKAAAKEEGKGEKKAAKASPAFKKFAKLTGDEQSFLRDFFSKIYGKEYVDALLGDY